MTGEASREVSLLRRVLQAARPYRLHLVGVFVLSLLSAPFMLLTPLPIKIAVDNVIGDEPLPTMLDRILPDAVSSSDGGLLAVAIGMLILFSLLQHGEGFLSWILQLYTGEKIVLDFRTRLFRHVQRLSLLHHDSRGVTDSLYRIQHDAPCIQYVLVQGAVPAVTSILTVVAMLAVTAWIDWVLALIALAIVPILMILTEHYRRRVRRGWAAVKEQESAAMSVVQEVLSAVRVVKAFGREDYEEQRFNDRAYRSLMTQIRVVWVEAGFGLLVALCIASGTAAVLYIGVRHVNAGILSLGDLLVVMAYLAMLYKPLETLSKKVASLQASMASVERAYQILDTTPEVVESPRARALEHADGRITFEAVGFAYRDGPDVLRDISFEVAPGASVGISGRTGAGKTTLICMLQRFYDPSRGRILLDGVDLRDYRLADLREQFGVVLQEPVLFATTIAENIAYGRPGASQDDIVAAAKAANAHDFIIATADGYDTVLGERGMGLSGGERQRISIARAFLKNAPILLLDEPTSSLDSGSEAPIIDAIQRLMENRTTIMIAHRLSTLDSCDMRLHIEDDRSITVRVREETADVALAT